MLERTIRRHIERISKGYPALMLTGPCRTGKSVLLSMMNDKNRKYVSLNNPDDRNMAKNNPVMFLRKYSPPMIIDEVQYAPELFPYIKILADSLKTKYNTNSSNTANPDGVFWMTSSYKFRLINGIEESLGGSIAVIDMLGFSHKEASGCAYESRPFFPSMDMIRKESVQKLRPLDVYRIIWNGSFPEIHINKNISRNDYYRAYIQTYMVKDAEDSHGHMNETKFLNFLRAVALRTGNLLNYNSISRDSDIDLLTAQKWMNALERSGLVYLLNPYMPNKAHRIIKTPKVYFLDTGLAAYLAEIDSPGALEASYLGGPMLETWALIEILKSFWHNGEAIQLSYYRDISQKEIKFILEKNMILYPIEVKKTASPGVTDTGNFDVLKQFGKKIGTGAIICLNPNFTPLPKQDIISVPAWEL